MRMHGMKQKNKMKKKLNNAGMTLIEVLIAMVILAVAIAPLMRSFVQVAYYGNKGRSLQQTSGIAQTVMENCKAYNMKAIQLKFANRTLIAHDYTSGASWIDASTGDDYHYFIDGMTVDNREVGMEILIKPMNTKDASGIAMPFEADFMNYDNVNDVMDAVFVPQHTMATTHSTSNFRELEREICLNDLLMTVLNHIKAADNTLTLSVFNLWTDYIASGPNRGELAFKRDIEIETYSDGGFDKVKVTYIYQLIVNDPVYDYTDAVTGDPKTITIPVSSMTKQDSAIIYDNTATKVNNAALERIYFYYYPAFNNYDYYDFPCVEDKITIKNNIGKDVDFYLIKQNNTAINDSEEEIMEDGYDVKVQVQGENVVNLYHNLRTNMGTPVGDDRPFASASWPVETDDLTTSGTVTVNDMHSLIIDENRKLMYTIDIKAYANPEYDATSKTMSGDELLSLSGTKINW